MDNERPDPERLRGQVAALELISVSLIRLLVNTPESRRALAASLRSSVADVLDGPSISFRDGLKDTLLEVAAKIESNDH